MPFFTIIIGGIDFSDIVSHEGLPHLSEKLSPEDTGRTEDARMHKIDVATKVSLDVSLIDNVVPSRFVQLSQALRINEASYTPISRSPASLPAVQSRFFKNLSANVHPSNAAQIPETIGSITFIESNIAFDFLSISSKKAMSMPFKQP